MNEGWGEGIILKSANPCCNQAGAAFIMELGELLKFIAFIVRGAV